MRFRSSAALGVLAFTAWGVLHAQKPFRLFDTAEEHAEMASLPKDYLVPAEFVRARMRYTGLGYSLHGFESGWNSWTIDYPRSDRHVHEGIRRLTRIDSKSVEQVVDFDGSDDPYNWPFMYAVEVGHWKLRDDEAAQLRDYLLRGGFLMVDDFHGTIEWEVFVDSMRKVFPDRTIVDLDSKDAIFHVVNDLDDKFQVPGAQWFYSRKTYEQDGFDAKWRGIYDDRGRVMVAICHNMDLGDAWEWSDEAVYPEHWASLAYRILVNYVVYDLTH